MTEILPEVLLNALRQYNFDGSPLWRMADGKDHVQIQVTFRKSTEQQDKKRAVSRKKSTPSAGEWPRQPRPARRPTEILRQTPPPTEEILPAAPPATIERPPPAVTATYDESPIIAEPVEDEEEEEAMETRTTYIKECPESLPNTTSPRSYTTDSTTAPTSSYTSCDIKYRQRNTENQHTRRSTQGYQTALLYKSPSSKYHQEGKLGALDECTGRYTKKNSTATWDRTKKDYLQKLMNTKMWRQWEESTT